MIGIALLELLETFINESISIVDLVSLVEASHIFHSCALVKDQTAGENIRLEDVMGHMA
jgi:hypothetical protein